MTVLVTGATGFVGSHVARRLLLSGYDVRAICRPGSDRKRIADIEERIEIVEGDVFKATVDELTEICKGVHTCIHCAWYAVPGQYLMSTENIACLNGSIRLYEALGRVGCKRCVGVGTCLEYDVRLGRLAENAPIKTTTPYAAAKASTFLVGQQLCRMQDMSFVWARLFYLYGPGEDERRLVPYVTNALLNGRVAQVSNGLQERDYLHVEDAASALVALVDSEIVGAINIGSGKPLKVREIITRISEVVGRPELVDFGARVIDPSEPIQIYADTSKLMASTDWMPEFDLSCGLEQTVGWWKGQLAV